MSVKRHKITVEVTDTVYRLLSVLGPPKEIVECLIDHAQQGVYRPGSWERGWLSQAFYEDCWLDKLEPGDPYGRDGLDTMFNKPKAVS